MADEVAETFEYTLLGRVMQFRKPLGGQMIMLQRIHARGQEMLADGESLRAFNELSVKMLDIIDALFVVEADRAAVEKAMLRGEIDLDDLMPLLSGGRKPEQPMADDADPKPARKAAAKKTANTKRVKR